MRAMWVAVVMVVVACANASQSSDNQTGIDAPKVIDAKASPIDGPPGHPFDAPPPHIDAFVPDAYVPDAYVPPPPPDASTDGNVCTAQSQCTDAGECCLDFGTGLGICSPGTLIGTTCFPIS